MAEYGVQATQLSAPQGAGANVIAPVQEQDVDTGILPIAKAAVNIFAKGLEADREQAAKERQANIIGNYVKAEGVINDAVASGQITPAQASARSRALFQQYAAGFPEYIGGQGGLESAAKALKGFSEKGEVDRQLDNERDIRKRDIQTAQGRGFLFLPGMSQEVENQQIRASQAGIVAERELEAQYKKNSEARAQGNFNQQVADREAKEMSITLINNIAGENLQAFQGFTGTLAAQVRNGSLPPDQAALLLNERFANISGAIQSAARTNPELAGPYRSLFQEMNTIAQKLIDPKNAVEDLENQAKLIVNRAKVTMLQSSPQLAASSAASQLLGTNAELALAASRPTIDAITRFLNNTPGDGQFTPQVIGNPESEKDALNFFQGSISSLQQGKYTDETKAKNEIKNGLDNALIQVSNLQGKGALSYKNVAGFVASPQYAYAVNNGLISPEAAQVAKQAFQIDYEKEVIKGVQEKFNNYLYTQAAFKRGQQTDLTTLAQAVDVQFSGTGVVFKALPQKGLDPVAQRSQIESVQDLRKAQEAVNQLIHIGAHLEGTTDYQKYWEDNKHIFMPQVFPDPALLKPGGVVNGYKYLGGNVNDPRSWQPETGG